MFKTILAATDQATLRDTPALAALDFGSRYRSAVHILHVLESASAADRHRVQHDRHGTARQADRPYRDAVRDRLHRCYRENRQTPRACRVDVTTGLPWLAISQRARQIRADLIVIGPHRSHAMTREGVKLQGRFGSTAEGVVRCARCPVMIVNRTLPDRGATLKRIVVGIDFSAACECAVCFAVKAAQPDGAHVHVFHMLPIPPYPKYDRRDYTDDKYATRRRMTAFGAAYLDGTPHTYHIWGGVLPHEELLQCARHVMADLIILGSHTREQQGKWYAGSVVARVGRRAPCPVVVLNAPTALAPWHELKLATRREEVPFDRRLCVFGNRTPGGVRRSDQPGDTR